VVLKRNIATANYYDHLGALSVADIALAKTELESAIDKHESDVYYRDLSAVYLARLSEILASSDSEEVVKTQFQNDSSLAIQSALRATEIDESNYLNWVALSRAYSSLIQFGLPQGYENATEANSRALARNPYNPSIHLAQAQLELINGDRAKAKEALNKALDLKGNYTEAIFLLAQIQADEGNIAEAIQSTEVASLVAPNDFGVFFQLGFLKYTNEDYAGAVPAFARAIELNPVYANAMYFLGLSLYEIGNDTDAITVFERVQQLNPENEEVRDILNNLRTGEAPFGDSRRTPPEERRALPVVESDAVTPDEVGDELDNE
jgi:tetratricopeptide (TPR) repeat protein